MDAESTAAVRRGRGRRTLSEGPALDRARLIQVLVDLVRREGLQAINMRRVAAEAQVSPRLLYLHVRDKAEMIDLACDAITAEAAPTSIAGSWKERLTDIALVMRRGLGRYPGLAVWVLANATRPNQPPHVARMKDELFKGLAEAGLSRADADAAYLAYTAYTMGHLAMTEGAQARGAGDDLEALFSIGLGQLLDGFAAGRGR